MRARWLFFSLFSVLAMPGRFMPIFYSAHGQNDVQIGILMGTAPLISMFASPLLCNLADRLRRRELVAAITYFIAIICFLLQLVALPSLGILSAKTRFPVLLALRLGFGFFSCAAYPLVSAIAIAQLREEFGDKGHERFGRERLWGAVSWAVCALGLGVVLDLPGVEIWAVHVGIVLFGSCFILTLLMFERKHRHKGKALPENSVASPDQVDRTLLLAEDGIESSNDAKGEQFEAEETKMSKNSSSGTSMAALPAIYRILSTGGLPTVMFFNMFFWLNIGMSLVENLLFLFFQFDLHASNFVCGLSVVVTVIFEIPLFAMAPELLERLGAPALAAVGSLAFVARGFGYTFARNGWVILLFEPLHGVTFAANETATVAYVAERTPTELEATGQAVVTVLRTLAYTIGTVLGGWVMQKFGSKALYRAGGMAVLLATTAFILTDRLSRREGAEAVVSDDEMEGKIANLEGEEVGHVELGTDTVL